MYLMDPDGRIVSWNIGAERIKGYPAEEVIGRHLSLFYMPEDAAAAYRLLAKALARGSAEAEGWRVRRDGSRFWAGVVVTALYDHEHRHIGFAKVTRDLTLDHARRERVRRLREIELAASEQRFATFAQHLPGLAWIKDLKGRYVYVNDAALRAFGAPEREVIGHTDAELFDAEIAEEYRVNDSRALESWTGIQAVEQLRDRHGCVRHSIVSKFPVADGQGNFHRIGGVAIDITERVAAENALVDADRRKTEFLATLAHELRNPLAAIRNAVHLLRRGPDRPDTPVGDLLERQLQQLVRLVDDLLDVSRVSTGKLVLQRRPLDLREIVTNAVEASGMAMAGRRGITTNYPDVPVIVDGDAVRLAQVVTNLLSNAIKFTADTGHIDITLTAGEGEAGITIRDDGAGIDPRLVDRIFDMFAQLDPLSQPSQGGLGIGLTLARHFVVLHGGRIEASSAGPGTGSTFTVTLPRLHEAEPAIRQPAMEDRLAGQRVLVVDDNHDAADSTAMVLSVMGAETRCAYDGPSALESVAAWNPGAVILDLGMPGMDGYELARRIRALPDRRPSLIALSGWGSSADRARTAAAGFDDHWVKPVDPTRLAGLLRPAGRQGRRVTDDRCR
ncbi:MAG: hybrid sensor histidine kinase/response regulator [Gemmatimonadales bacterium]